MKLIDTTDDILSAFKDRNFSLETWENYAQTISPDLISLCETDSEKYPFQEMVQPVLTQVLADKDRLVKLSQCFHTLTDELQHRLPLLFPKGTDPELILYLGLCNGAGWMTKLNGRDVLLFGIEKIIELNWDNPDDLRGLIFHEIGHLWHKLRGNLEFPAVTSQERSLLQLWQEGIAMVCEQILCGNDQYYHQDKDGWLSWCLKHESLLKKEFGIRMDKEESTQDFFGDWCSFHGYSDTGYFLGCQFIRYLLKDYTLSEIAVLSKEKLFMKYHSFNQ